jgi:general secretion pathway protein K
VTRSARRQRGIVLVAVLFFIVLMYAAVATFVTRASIDRQLAGNRDLAARSEALARGGVQLGIALLLQDRVDEEAREFRVDTREDIWAKASELSLETPDGGTLRLRIEDAGERLNLNALFEDGRVRSPLTEVFLTALLAKVIGEMERKPERGVYDPQALAQSLIDWVDEDDVRVRGGPEDDYYQRQDPPYRAANRPLLSFEELGLVEGFDAALVAALEPYASVYPYAGGDGINPNTAPSYVLAVLFHGTAGDFRLATEDTVRRVLDIRTEGGILCADEANHPACTPIRNAVPGEVFPPPTYTTDVFRVRAEAAYGAVRRTVEAVIDRSDASAPLLLAWRAR